MLDLFLLKFVYLLFRCL